MLIIHYTGVVQFHLPHPFSTDIHKAVHPSIWDVCVVQNMRYFENLLQCHLR